MTAGRWRELFEIDLRSLAALRMAMAAVLLFDIVTRARFFGAVYVEPSISPPQLSGPWKLFCLHAWDGSAPFQLVLFATAALAAVLLGLGLATRAATLVSWLLLNSLLIRHPYLSDGGDSLLRLLLFWSLFLPLGAVWSLDARRSTGAVASPHFSVAGVALLLQPLVMYVVTGISKRGPEWIDGTAVFYAVSHDYWARPGGDFLRDYPAVCRALTYAARYSEIVAPLLMLSPLATRYARPVGIAALVGLQVGLIVSIDLWLLPIISTLSLLPFVPGALWDRLPVPAPTAPLEAAPTRRWRARLVAAVSAVAVAYVLFYSAHSARFNRGPRRLDTIGVLGLNATWQMYAPSPYRSEARLDISAQRNGETVPIEEIVGGEIGADIAGMRDDYRTKYHLEVLMSSRGLMRQFAEWLCVVEPALRPGDALLLGVTEWPIGTPDRRKRQQHRFYCR